MKDQIYSGLHYVVMLYIVMYLSPKQNKNTDIHRNMVLNLCRAVDQVRSASTVIYSNYMQKYQLEIHCVGHTKMKKMET
jgi:glycerol-3-phosphate cytidylyltransferase-like family protein